MNTKIYLPGDKVPIAGTYEVVQSNPASLPNQIHIRGFQSFPDLQFPNELGYRLVKAF